MSALKVKAAKRVELAFRPKTRRCYELLFRNIVGFCVCGAVNVSSPSLEDIMAYLEFIVENGVSANILANNLSALKAHFVMLGLKFSLFDHPRVKYFVKSVRINRPLCPIRRNIMSLETLAALSHQCMALVSPFTFRAIFLVSFFGFLRISNVAPL